MKIIDIQEKIVQISSEIKNAYISFAKMDCSVVAIKTDVQVDGENVVGYGISQRSAELARLGKSRRNARIYGCCWSSPIRIARLVLGKPKNLPRGKPMVPTMDKEG